LDLLSAYRAIIRHSQVAVFPTGSAPNPEVFKTGAINRSATSPLRGGILPNSLVGPRMLPLCRFTGV
jgi:hypothetical protein